MPHEPVRVQRCHHGIYHVTFAGITLHLMPEALTKLLDALFEAAYAPTFQADLDRYAIIERATERESDTDPEHGS